MYSTPPNGNRQMSSLNSLRFFGINDRPYLLIGGVPSGSTSIPFLLKKNPSNFPNLCQIRISLDESSCFTDMGGA